jgi:hypothetical protein
MPTNEYEIHYWWKFRTEINYNTKALRIGIYGRKLAALDVIGSNGADDRRTSYRCRQQKNKTLTLVYVPDSKGADTRSVNYKCSKQGISKL